MKVITLNSPTFTLRTVRFKKIVKLERDHMN